MIWRRRRGRGDGAVRGGDGGLYHDIEIGNDNQRAQALSEMIRHGVPSARARHCAAM